MSVKTYCKITWKLVNFPFDIEFLFGIESQNLTANVDVISIIFAFNLCWIIFDFLHLFNHLQPLLLCKSHIEFLIRLCGWVSWQRLSMQHFTSTKPKAKTFLKLPRTLTLFFICLARKCKYVHFTTFWNSHLTQNFNALEAVLFPSGHANPVWVFKTINQLNTYTPSLCSSALYLS